MTDLEGSTPLWEGHPEQMLVALRRHDELIAESVSIFRGAMQRQQGEGDSALAAFSRVSDAIGGALHIQQSFLKEPWPEDVSLRVRIGIQTGEAEPHDGNYRGPVLNRCARLRSAANGGQTLVSANTAELARDTLPKGATLLSLGKHLLRGLAEQVEIFQLSHPDLPARFPPIRTLGPTDGNVPVTLTSFVGRTEEISELTSMFGSTRLVTLTGPGGMGKTRLAIEVASRVGDLYPDGVWVVELDSLSEPRLVEPALAAVLGVAESQSKTLSRAIEDRLRGAQALLLLDNCEHVIQACATLVDRLLRTCRRVRVLATSREPLKVDGETVWRLPPLSSPGPGVGLEESLRHDAAKLFVERAEATNPALEMTEDAAAAVSEITRRLEGNPLAIELAAAWAGVLSFDEVAHRLEEVLELAPGREPGGPERHRSTSAAIEWSYRLLSPATARFFRCLSIFQGGFILEAAESLYSNLRCDGPGALELVSWLVDKSLLQREDRDGRSRFRMLETIRTFAAQQALLNGENTAIAAAHAAWVLEFGRQAKIELTGPRQNSWMDMLESEHDNLRSALEWALSTEVPQTALGISGSIWWFWYVRGHLSEGISWIERSLLIEGARERPEAGPALVGAGALAWAQGDFTTAKLYATEAHERFENEGDRAGLGWSLLILGWVAQMRGDFERARFLHSDSLVSFREAEDQPGIGAALYGLACLADAEGDRRTARPLLEEVIASRKKLGHAHGLAASLTELGEILRVEGSYKESMARFEEALEIFGSLGDQRGTGVALLGLAGLARNKGEYQEARELALQSLYEFRRLGDRSGVASGLHALGAISIEEGDPAGARRPLEESLEIRQASGETRAAARTLALLGRASLYEGDPGGTGMIDKALETLVAEGDQAGAAEAYLFLGIASRGGPGGKGRDRLKSALSVHDLLTRRYVITGVEALAGTAADEGRIEPAARLMGAASAERARTGSPVPHADRDAYESDVDKVRSDPQAKVWWRDGEEMDLASAVALALDL